jgi:integrase
MLAIRSSA